MKIGLIGTGNMGQAILRGCLKAKPREASGVYVYNHHLEKAQRLGRELGINACGSIEELVMASQLVLLAVKPYHFAEVMPQVAKAYEGAADKDEKIIVSIAAGVTIQQMEDYFRRQAGPAEGLSGEKHEAGVKIVRVMPNTPALVGEAMSSVSANACTDSKSLEAVLELFRWVGRAEAVEEKLIDAVIGVSGSSPAYVYMFIEALADGAVAEGMQRDKAYAFAAQAVFGAAKMVLETGKHPGELKDQVCSPGGTTILAVKELEERGLRAAVLNAVHTAAEKSRAMS